MAITKVQGNARGTTTGSSISVTLNSAPTNGNILVAVIDSSVVSNSSYVTVSSISQTSVNWSSSGAGKQVGKQYNDGAWDALNVEIWVGIVGSSASSTLTVTLSGSATEGAACDVCEYSGVATSNFLDQTASSSGMGSNPSTGTTATTTYANELWIGGIVSYETTQSSATNSFTLLDGAAISGPQYWTGLSYLERIASSTEQAYSSVNNSNYWGWVGCIATFKPAIMTATSNCNCTTNTGMQDYCNKGVTLWGTGSAIDIHIPSGETRSVSFTGTQPKGYKQKSACNVTWGILTDSDSSSSDVRIDCYLNSVDSNHSIGQRVHSKRSQVQGQRHDITETYDLAPLDNNYNDGGFNTIYFVNNSDVGVWINNIRIIRIYEICYLGDSDCYSQYPGQSTTSDGTLDWTREDYPCLYESYGVRYSFTKFGPDSSQGYLVGPGSSKSWTFVNPDYSANYVGPYCCLFNFNNLAVYTQGNDPQGDDVQYTVSVNGHNIATFYQSKNKDLTQFTGVDLAKSQYYNDAPNAINTVTLTNNDQNATLWLRDGGATVGNIDIYRVYRTANNCQDNFNDNTTDTAIWEKVQVNSATASETGGQLQVTVPSGSGWAQAGYVSKYGYNVLGEYGFTLQGLETIVDVTQLNNVDQMLLMICNTKVTASDPYDQSNWYRIVKGRRCWGNNVLAVENRINGTWASKLNIPWISSTGQLKISVSTGSIALYENGILKYAEPFALPSSTCYVYAYTSSDKAVSVGTDKFDNYATYPTEMFRDDFKDGNYNGWTVDSGSWQVTNGQLTSTASGHIHNNTSFTANRHVKADVKTLTAGSNVWEVPWLYVKEQDGNNNIYALIHTNGNVELSMWYQGNKTSWFNQSSPALDPFQNHVIAVSIIGTNAKMWVDGTLYHDVTNANFANLSGYVGLYTPSSTGALDNIVVFDE